MKRYLLERGICPRSDFVKAMGIEKPRSLNELLAKAQAYIQYEEREVADAIRHSRPEDNPPPQESNPPPREFSHNGGDRKRNDRPREPQGPPSQFMNYTPLLTSREHILSECADTEFRQARIRFPKQVPTKPHQDKSKFCRYHKAHGHFVKRRDNPRPEPREANAAKEEKPAAGGQDLKQFAMCISRPEDFFVSKDISTEITALSRSENFPQAMVIFGG
ncbi:hypothetical protein A2U01_0020140 [Trifolium medium]|uniref:Uncharacterized protein n=1 Tax=Trifolium medium TaxID=97028 RepID=A0A392NIQ7_9FABA|nr:hypothetical protein [Trifolium medium]